MGNPRKSHNTLRCRLGKAGLAALALFWPCTAAGQTAITGATFGSLVDGPNVPAYTTVPVTFQQTSIAVQTFTTAAGNYEVSSAATSAYVRRNTVNANNSSVWYNNSSGVSTTLDGTYQTTLSSVYLGNNILMGGDNVFSNGNAATQGNIERIDFVWNSGITMASTDGFAVLERGAVGGHDSFGVAVITGFGTASIGGTPTSNVPTSYSTVLQATSATYGSSNVYTYTNPFQVVRYGNGDNLTDNTAINPVANVQGLGGVFFTLADFGVAGGTTVYGYSILADDWTKAPKKSTTLVDWTNTTYYPTNSTNGLDLSAVNGMAFRRVIPEPGTYGAIMVTCGLVLVAWRRRRLARRLGEENRLP